MPDLLALALQAIDEPEAVVVLADEVRERAWFDERAARMLCQNFAGRDPFGGGLERIWFEEMIFFWDRLPHAIAATLLFGDWPTAWPLAQNEYFPFVSLPWSWDLRVDAPRSNMIAVDRQTDPTRLAGQVIESSFPTHVITDERFPGDQALIVSPDDAIRIRNLTMPKESNADE